MTTLPRILVWNEYRHEKQHAAVAAVYPDGIHEAIAQPLRAAGFPVRTATLDEPEHGLSERALVGTDVLLWWGHMAHDEVDDAVVTRVQQRVIAKQLRTVPTPPSTGVWQQYLAVRSGEIANPSPPHVGLRMAQLYDAIKESAAQGGQPVRLA